MGPDSASFFEALDSADVEYRRIERTFSGPQNNAGVLIVLICAVADKIPWKSFERCFMDWMKAKQNRRVIVKVEGRAKVFDAKGYSAEEIAKILAAADSAEVLALDK